MQMVHSECLEMLTQIHRVFGKFDIFLFCRAMDACEQITHSDRPGVNIHRQLRITHITPVHKENTCNKERSPHITYIPLFYHRAYSKRKHFASSGRKLFPLRIVPIFEEILG